MELNLGIILMKTYKSELIRSMKFLANDNKTIFLGQSVAYPGNSMFNTLVGISDRKKIELPVFEEVQMGMSIGLAMEGYLPVTCYPRFDFLLLAMNQLINHLDKIRVMSNGDFKLKVIIRTAIGAKKPLDGGPQHTQDYTSALKKMCKEIKIIKLNDTKKIFSTYKKIYNDKSNYSYIVVEDGDKFNKK